MQAAIVTKRVSFTEREALRRRYLGREGEREPRKLRSCFEMCDDGWRQDFVTDLVSRPVGVG